MRPIDEVARFLGGSAPVEIVAPRATKAFDLTVVVPGRRHAQPAAPAGCRAAASTRPAAPQTRTGSPTGDGSRDGDGRRAPSRTETTGSLWPHVEEAIVDRILQHRSTIVFSNSRRLAERLTGRLNEIYAERLGLESDRLPRRDAASARGA